MSRTYRLLHGLVVVALLLAAIGQALPTQAAPVDRSARPGPLAQRATEPAQTQPGIDSLETPAAPTASGPSMYLNGTNYVSIPNVSLPAIGSGDFTLEAWVYPTNVTGFHAVMAKWYSAGFWFGIYNGKLRFYRGSTTFVESTAAIPINRWTHIAVASYYEPYTGSYLAELYINGDREGVYLHSGGAAVGGTYSLNIGSDQGTEFFVGDIAEARLWSGARGGESARRDMHHAINEKRTGLIANWHLTGDFKDSINGIDGTPVGSPAFVGFPSPAQPDVSQTDRFFNTLPQVTYAAGTAFVPRLNRAILAGGYRAGVPSAVVTAVDAGSGAATNIGSLPAARAYSTAAYAASNDTVYVFGGSDQLATTNAFDSIYAINPDTGAARTVAATLPAGRNNAVAVYVEHLNQIVILGGWYYDAGVEKYADTIYVFDVATESISTAPFTLLQPGFGLAAAYSPLTQQVYFFGGSPDGGVTFDDKGYALTLNANHSGSITTLTAKLPKGDRGGVAVEDPVSHLIYIINGQYNGNVIAFDPASLEVWRTPIELPRNDAGTLLIRPYSSVIYSARQRHALVIGGGFWNQAGDNNVWRIPLGDGPSVPIGHWDSINSQLGNLDYLSSVYWRVAMGRANAALKYFDSDGYARYPGAYTAAGMGGMSVDPSDGTTWFTTWSGNTVNVRRDSGGAVETRYTETRVVPVTAANAPDAVVPYNNHTPFFGSGFNLKWQNVNDYILGTWHNSFVGPGVGNWDWTHIPAIAHRNFSEAWAIVEPWYNSIGRPGNAPDAGPVPTRPQLGRLYYEYYSANYAENLYGFPCGASLWAKDLVFGLNGDWWIGGDGGVCRYSSLYPPTSFAGNLFAPTIGTNVKKLSVDGDGRIWAAVMPDTAGNSGGLSAYEVRGPANTLGSVRTQDWNWLTAPIGSLTSLANGWNSGIRAITANGERVWMALNTDPDNGPLAMYSPRWQQLTAANESSLWGARRVFLARGRAFIATNGDRLITLQPDGITWDDRALPGVKAVTADQTGRIWIGASDGVRRWLPTGWDMIEGALGTPPTGPINAIAADSKGRMWIGGESGLTLFDRDRWVTTIAPPTGSISVTAVLIDRDDNVWAGTAQGLAKLNTTDQTWTMYTTANNLYTNSIFDLQLLGDGKLAVSTSGTGGGLSLFDGTTFTKQTYPPGADQPLTADNIGRLWAGAINREPTGYYGRFWTNSGLINSTVIDNASDGSNLVWFTHPSGGVSIRSSFLPPLAEVQPQINPANGIVPNRGSENDVVYINGSGFGTNPSEVSVMVGGAPVDIETVNDAQIKAHLRGDNLSGDVTVRRGKRSVTLGGGATPPFCAVPKITGVTPTGGNVGVEIKITGSNFDPNATVQLGGGGVKPLGFKGAGTASVWIATNDTNGNLVINNQCVNTSATFNDFRKINLSIGKVMINQGYGAMGLLANRATLVSAFIIKDQPERPSDKLQVDNLAVSVVRTSDLASISDRTIPVAAGFPAALGSFPPGFTNDISQSLNMPLVLLAPGNMRVDVRLTNRAAQVASATSFADVARNYDLNVLLVPIVPDGFSPDQMNALKSKVDGALSEPNFRLMPSGGIFSTWSRDVMVTDPVNIGSDNYLTGLRKYAIQLDRIRQRTNSGYGIKYGIVLGIVAEGHNTSSTPGASFRPETSADANFWLGIPDILCDFGNDVVHTVSLGLLGSDDGCHLDYPTHVGWVEAKDGPDSATQDTLGRVMSHELGHILNLVDNGTANFDSGNEDHSRNDEIGNGTCDSGAIMDQSLTFIQADTIVGPVVNPMRGTQLRQTDMGNLSSVQRPKAIMSYACGRKVYNTFFEPADLAYEQAYLNVTGLLRQPPLLRSGPTAATLTVEPQARVIPGPRLHVAGLITSTGAVATGTINRVETLDDDAPISAPILTGYWLVQQDANGAELMRWPVMPAFSEVEDTLAAPDASGEGFFGVTMTRTQAVASLVLLKDDVPLATFTAGANPPIVTLTSPSGGENYASGSVPVAWTAMDPDNDPLEVSIDFSGDNGATWQPVAAATGSGTVDIPVEQIQGTSGATAHIRVVASDGLTQTVAASGGFTIAPQPPRAVILNPTEGDTALESQAVTLYGQGVDSQQGILTGTHQLTWISDRDGTLGSGSQVDVLLSVGLHTITLQAENSAGLTATTQITLTVLGDYDGDGVPDTIESSSGTNPLTAVDALGDEDGDGLINAVEQTYGTGANNPDSDGDGRSDGEEVAQGTDPLAMDTPTPDQLTVSPATLVFTADLSIDTTLPQRWVQVLSGVPATWTVTSSAAWLHVFPLSGITPAPQTVMVDPSAVGEGTYTAMLTYSSTQLGSSVTLPITVTVINKASYCDANRDGVTDQQDTAAVQAHVGAAYGQPAYRQQYDLNRDGVINTQDVLLASVCLSQGEVKRVFLPLVRR